MAAIQLETERSQRAAAEEMAESRLERLRQSTNELLLRMQHDHDAEAEEYRQWVRVSQCAPCTRQAGSLLQPACLLHAVAGNIHVSSMYSGKPYDMSPLDYLLGYCNSTAARIVSCIPSEMFVRPVPEFGMQLGRLLGLCRIPS